MKTILWAQNEDALIKDTFIIDGVVSEAGNTPEEIQAFSELTKASMTLKLSSKTRRGLSEKKGFSEQANFSIQGNTYYIQGCFNEKDNVGRDMPYMFLTTECKSFEEAVKRLKECSSLINRQCNELDLKLISKLSRHEPNIIDKAVRSLKSSKKDSLKIVITSVIVILIIFIWILVR